MPFARRASAHPAVVEAEEVNVLASFPQVHDPRPVFLHSEAELGEDRPQRLKRPAGRASIDPVEVDVDAPGVAPDVPLVAEGVGAPLRATAKASLDTILANAAGELDQAARRCRSTLNRPSRRTFARGNSPMSPPSVVVPKALLGQRASRMKKLRRTLPSLMMKK